MKPKPFLLSNHLTLPLAILISCVMCLLPQLRETGQRRPCGSSAAGMRLGYRVALKKFVLLTSRISFSSATRHYPECPEPDPSDRPCEDLKWPPEVDDITARLFIFF